MCIIALVIQMIVKVSPCTVTDIDMSWHFEKFFVLHLFAFYMWINEKYTTFMWKNDLLWINTLKPLFLLMICNTYKNNFLYFHCHHLWIRIRKTKLSMSNQSWKPNCCFWPRCYFRSVINLRRSYFKSLLYVF